MRQQLRLIALVGAIVFLGSACYGATITGTVKGADGAPFQGAFVEAQNTKTKITVIVLSDSQGRYPFPIWRPGITACRSGPWATAPILAPP